MGAARHLPVGLTRAPFTLREARAAGLDLDRLRGRSWRRLGTELYCWRGWRDERWALLRAWSRLLPGDAVFGGHTAAWMWGLEAPSPGPVEVVLPPGSAVRERQGLSLRRCRVDADEVVEMRGTRATALHRTLRDLCARSQPVDALAAIDAALHLGRTDKSQLLQYVDEARGRAGARKLRALAVLAEPAESQMESRLRWLLVQARLPRPSVQVELHDSDGGFVGRADMFYPAQQLVIEYDGANHRERLVEDDRRQNLLLDAGFRLLRFTAADIDRPELVASQVRQALRSASLASNS